MLDNKKDEIECIKTKNGRYICKVINKKFNVNEFKGTKEDIGIEIINRGWQFKKVNAPEPIKGYIETVSDKQFQRDYKKVKQSVEKKQAFNALRESLYEHYPEANEIIDSISEKILEPKLVETEYNFGTDGVGVKRKEQRPEI
jgi:hypothetical protein